MEKLQNSTVVMKGLIVRVYILKGDGAHAASHSPLTLENTTIRKTMIMSVSIRSLGFKVTTPN